MKKKGNCSSGPEEVALKVYIAHAQWQMPFQVFNEKRLGEILKFATCSIFGA